MLETSQLADTLARRADALEGRGHQLRADPAGREEVSDAVRAYVKHELAREFRQLAAELRGMQVLQWILAPE